MRKILAYSLILVSTLICIFDSYTKAAEEPDTVTQIENVQLNAKTIPNSSSTTNSLSEIYIPVNQLTDIKKLTIEIDPSEVIETKNIRQNNANLNIKKGSIIMGAIGTSPQQGMIENKEYTFKNYSSVIRQDKNEFRYEIIDIIFLDKSRLKPNAQLTFKFEDFQIIKSGNITYRVFFYLDPEDSVPIKQSIIKTPVTAKTTSSDTKKETKDSFFSKLTGSNNDTPEEEAEKDSESLVVEQKGVLQRFIELIKDALGLK